MCKRALFFTGFEIYEINLEQFASRRSVMSRYHRAALFLDDYKNNDDGESNENGKKAKGSYYQNNNFVRVAPFLVHFLPVVARVPR